MSNPSGISYSIKSTPIIATLHQGPNRIFVSIDYELAKKMNGGYSDLRVAWKMYQAFLMGIELHKKGYAG